MPHAVGLDIGTSYTAGAVYEADSAFTVKLGMGAFAVPTVVLAQPDGSRLIGDEAEMRALATPGRVAREFKRYLGQDVPVYLDGEAHAAEDLMADMLRWVLEQMASQTGEPPTHVTLTHPATWGEYTRERLMVAAQLAGLDGVGLLAEPDAAAIFSANQTRLEPGSIVAIYDLGGGTFDATVLEKTTDSFRLRGRPVGDDDIGGADFDQRLTTHVSEVAGLDLTTVDLTSTETLRELSRLRRQVVEAKEVLSSELDAGVDVDVGGSSRAVRVTRGELENLIRADVDRTLDTTADALDRAGVPAEDLHGILLVGGSSRIPLISQMVVERFRVPVLVDAHPKLSVCLGAAITAGAVMKTGAAAPPPTAPVPGPEPVPPEPVPEPEPEPEPVPPEPVPEPEPEPAPPEAERGPPEPEPEPEPVPPEPEVEPSVEHLLAQVPPEPVPEPATPVPVPVPEPEPEPAPPEPGPEPEPEPVPVPAPPEPEPEPPEPEPVAHLVAAVPTLDDDTMVRVPVDLPGKGLTGLSDVPLRPAVELRRKSDRPTDIVDVIRTEDAPRNWLVPAVAVAILVVVVVLVLVAGAR